MMKTEHKVLVSAFLMGILIAVIDALLDFLFFYEGTFLELLIFNIPPHEFYTRSVVVICFISFGFVVGRVLNQREQAMEHSEYLYSVLSATRNVNQLIVKETDPDLLLQKACELLIETRGYSHSWIVLFDTNRQLTNSASAGLAIEFEHMLEMVRRGEPLECMKRAMEQSGIFVFDALSVEHEACPINPLCREGVALVTRLEARGGVQGVFGVGAPAGMVAEEELSLFKEVADDIAFALYSHEVEDAGSRAHLALMESEERHRLILNSMNDMIFILDRHDCYSEFYASPNLMPYVSPEEFLGKSVADIMPLELAERMTELIKRVRETGNREILEYTLQMNENELWFSAAFDLHQNGESIVAVVREITKRKRTEFELYNVNRALRAMSAVNAVVVHAQDELKLLSDVCQVLVNISGYRLAWVGFAEHDKDKTVRPVAQWGFEEGYLRTVDITWSDTERGLGPTGTAIRTGIPITVTNIQKDPKYAPWNAEATERGYACAIALPLLEDGHPFGALNIYAKELDAFNQEEVNLLMELASSLAYGIRSVRAHVEREQVTETAMLYLDLMGHDIRNHLQAIVMGAEILTSADLDANQSSVIDLITESVERSRSLIHKVQKTQELLSIPLSEKPLISALKNSLEVLKQTHEDIEIEVDYKIRRATIRADRYLETLMMNLLENAVIHNNKDPRKLWVTLSKAEEGYEISIADNGPGISDEKKLALFDPKRRFGGVGVHQALRIVQKYDGRISVHDRVVGNSSQGAELRLWLPRSDTSA